MFCCHLAVNNTFVELQMWQQCEDLLTSANPKASQKGGRKEINKPPHLIPISGCTQFTTLK